MLAAGIVVRAKLGQRPRDTMPRQLADVSLEEKADIIASNVNAYASRDFVHANFGRWGGVWSTAYFDWDDGAVARMTIVPGSGETDAGARALEAFTRRFHATKNGVWSGAP
jgi:hypothetical protein